MDQFNLLSLFYVFWTIGLLVSLLSVAYNKGRGWNIVIMVLVTGIVISSLSGMYGYIQSPGEGILPEVDRNIYELKDVTMKQSSCKFSWSLDIGNKTFEAMACAMQTFSTWTVGLLTSGVEGIVSIASNGLLFGINSEWHLDLFRKGVITMALQFMVLLGIVVFVLRVVISLIKLMFGGGWDWDPYKSMFGAVLGWILVIPVLLLHLAIVITFHHLNEVGGINLTFLEMFRTVGARTISGSDNWMFGFVIAVSIIGLAAYHIYLNVMIVFNNIKLVKAFGMLPLVGYGPIINILFDTIAACLALVVSKLFIIAGIAISSNNPLATLVIMVTSIIACFKAKSEFMSWLEAYNPSAITLGDMLAGQRYLKGMNSLVNGKVQNGTREEVTQTGSSNSKSASRSFNMEGNQTGFTKGSSSSTSYSTREVPNIQNRWVAAKENVTRDAKNLMNFFKRGVKA